MIRFVKISKGEGYGFKRTDKQSKRARIKFAPASPCGCVIPDIFFSWSAILSYDYDFFYYVFIDSDEYAAFVKLVVLRDVTGFYYFNRVCGFI